MITHIAQVFEITDQDQLLDQFKRFEQDLYQAMLPLEEKFSQSLIGADVVKLKQHMFFVESWRHRCNRFNSLAIAFLEHSQSTHFMLPSAKGVTVVEKEAHVKRMRAGFKALQSFTENTLDDIDSRVNVCKKELGVESNLSPRMPGR